jgi:hypothetical protein
MTLATFFDRIAPVFVLMLTLAPVAGALGS